MRYLFLAIALVFSLANTSASEESSPLNDSIQAHVDKGEDALGFELAKQAAEETGDHRAHEWLGWFYDYGRGVEPNLERAIYHYGIAIEGGRNYARWRMGVLIDEGRAPGTLEYAVELFETAAAEDFSNAMTSLAVMQATGRGTAVDYEAAMQNYMRAAQAGNPHGIQGVGVLFALGQGVPEDPIEATAWFLVAAVAGDEMGQQNSQRYFEIMSEGEKQAAVERAQEIAESLGFETDIRYDPDFVPPPEPLRRGK